MIIVGFTLRLINLFAISSNLGLLFYSLVLPVLLVKIEQGFPVLINAVLYILILTLIVNLLISKNSIFDKILDKFIPKSG